MAYGYVRDKEPLSINWAEISKNFNDRLAADEAERQGKRDDIQKQYDELSQQLIDKPTGADTDLNSAIASFTTLASQASLDALNRLKEERYQSKNIIIVELILRAVQVICFCMLIILIVNCKKTYL